MLELIEDFGSWVLLGIIFVASIVWGIGSALGNAIGWDLASLLGLAVG